MKKRDDNEIIHEGLNNLYGKEEKQKRNMKFLENAENQKYTNNNQTHYKQGGIEPITFILANNLNFAEGNVIKYVTRYKFKDGLRDLQKALDYVNILIGEYENDLFKNSFLKFILKLISKIENRINKNNLISCEDYILKNNLNNLEGSIIRNIIKYNYTNSILRLELVERSIKKLIEEYKKDV